MLQRWLCVTIVCITDFRHRARPGGSTFADYSGSRKRTFLPAIAAGGGDGRQEGNSWVAEIDVVVKRSTAGTSPVAIKTVLIRP